MMVADDLREAIARIIADQISDGYDNAFRDKSEWIDDRCVKSGRARDINEPFQSDYDDAADAILALLKERGLKIV